MPSSVTSHSHRSTTKSTQKAFKSRKSSKGVLKELTKGKVEKTKRQTPHQQMMSKMDRRNRNNQIKDTKHKEHLRDANVFAGPNAAPRIVAVIPLCADGSAADVINKLSDSIAMPIEVPEEGSVRTEVKNRFGQKIQYVALKRDLISCLDAGGVADFVIFVLSPDQEVDALGELIIRSVESQGLSTLLTVVQGLDKIQPAKRQLQVLASLKSYITHFHPGQEKVHNVDSIPECANLMRSICTTNPKGIRWREDRSWMLIDNVQWPESEDGHAIVTGVIRGKGLKADRLVQVGDWGDFQIEKITAAPLTTKKAAEEMTLDSDGENVLDAPTTEQDDLDDLAPEEIFMEDDNDAAMSMATTHTRGVLLDDHHYFSDDETHLPAKPKRLPKGTSNYQAAWFLGDNFSDSGSDFEDVDEQGDSSMAAPALPQDGVEGFAPREPTEFEPTEYAKSEMFLDPNPEDDFEAEQLAAFRRRKGDEAEEDREFPDEVELPPNVLARERLAKYRGLKSLRSSHWEEAEDRAHEPEDWRRLLQIKDYRLARCQAEREAMIGGVTPGTRVHIHLHNVPKSLQATYNPSRPLTMFSLLRHEHKRAAVNFNFTLNSEYGKPIKSKEEMIIQCGPRRLVVNPLFSQGGNTLNDVHKFDRFLHPGGNAVATFIAPLTWGSVPTLFFKRNEDPNSEVPMTLLGTGTSLPPSSKRVIAKRIILTGHPYKIHKKLVTIRYMFFNREDVEWFKALQMWTKRGRSGFIKESLGTHGYLKATFDGKINPQDSVGVSLYKRMWPRQSRAWDASALATMKTLAVEEIKDTDMDMDGIA
ncbi:putative ribosome biogenesis protein tsr1 like protein [Calycina marina]|uniref:Ribosome biogenesis protein tsr1 like protein n=1 Tax=Calycina marina TaxID=1763456 RepID=A0A9P7Z2H6_9HELO|nr:putative ribosome biogenesis protein tsr1 like protein [Calycina marina]